MGFRHLQIVDCCTCCSCMKSMEQTSADSGELGITQQSSFSSASYSHTTTVCCGVHNFGAVHTTKKADLTGDKYFFVLACMHMPLTNFFLTIEQFTSFLPYYIINYDCFIMKLCKCFITQNLHVCVVCTNSCCWCWSDRTCGVRQGGRWR